MVYTDRSDAFRLGVQKMHRKLAGGRGLELFLFYGVHSAADFVSLVPLGGVDTLSDTLATFAVFLFVLLFVGRPLLKVN